MSIEKHVDLETLANVITSIPSNIFLKDRDLKYVFSSHIWEQVDKGDDEDFDIYGKTDRDIRKDTANLDNVEKTDRQIMETGIGTRYTIKSEIDGHTQYLELVKEPVRNKEGEIIGIVGLINDVTQVTQEIRDRLENEKSYRQAMKYGAEMTYNVNLTNDLLLDDLIGVVDNNTVNMMGMLGIKAPCSYSKIIEIFGNKVLTGRDREEFVKSHNSEYLIELFNKGQRQIVKEFKLDVKSRDGSIKERWARETILLMRNTAGEITAFFAINDTTKQRQKEEHIRFQLEENVKEAKRVADMKSDFLANMSHEIRTPMNAVIGMAEMALREDLPEAARDYINQIKSSGNALLNIINDILDFSKIESGKMDIIPDNYDPLSVIHDMSGILMNRIGSKDIELVADINPDLPIGLYGDAMRIRQVVINLANNAIKFTQSGYVRTTVDFEKTGENEIMLKMSVVDTGIGIKEEDLDKLFVSFQQVDSKRNRNIEGTGLGLAICARLVELMGGTVSVSSEYGKGSTFSFSIPQKVTDWTPSLNTTGKDNQTMITYWEEGTVNNILNELPEKLGIENYSYKDPEIAGIIDSASQNGRQVYFLTSHKLYSEELVDYADAHTDIKFIVLCDWLFAGTSSKANVMFIKKPLSTIGISMAISNEFFHVMENDAMEFDFIALDAKVLIVDDNEVNLVVAKGLIEPLNMQVSTANSGKKALEMLENETFDLVFMDHMMPELDGIETTRIIRRLHPNLDSMPIIALTANAVGGAKEMFLSEGMNDFVAKPIEIKTITAKIRQWLPEEKLKYGMKKNDSAPSNEQNGPIVIGDLDVNAAISLIGSRKLYMAILEKYTGTIKAKAEIIKKCELEEDIKNYTIEVHALKSSSKQIGAMELSQMAADLEAAGNREDIAMIHEKTDELIKRYTDYLAVFSPLFSQNNAEDKAAISNELLLDFFEKMLNAAEELDMDAMEEIAKEMDQYSYAGDDAKLISSLKEAVANIDVETIEEIITSWKQTLSA